MRASIKFKGSNTCISVDYKTVKYQYNFQNDSTEKNVAAVSKAAMPSEYQPYYKTLVEYYVSREKKKNIILSC